MTCWPIRQVPAKQRSPRSGVSRLPPRSPAGRSCRFHRLCGRKSPPSRSARPSSGAWPISRCSTASTALERYRVRHRPGAGGIGACTLALLNAGMANGDPAPWTRPWSTSARSTPRNDVLALQTMIFARAEPDQRQIADPPQRPQAATAPNQGGRVCRGVELRRHRPRRQLEQPIRPAGVARGRARRRGEQRRDLAAGLCLLAECQNEDGSWGYMLQVARPARRTVPLR